MTNNTPCEVCNDCADENMMQCKRKKRVISRAEDNKQTFITHSMKNFALSSQPCGPIEELKKKLKMQHLSSFPEASEGTFSIPCEDQSGN